MNKVKNEFEFDQMMFIDKSKKWLKNTFYIKRIKFTEIRYNQGKSKLF